MIQKANIRRFLPYGISQRNMEEVTLLTLKKRPIHVRVHYRVLMTSVGIQNLSQQWWIILSASTHKFIQSFKAYDILTASNIAIIIKRKNRTYNKKLI